MKIKVFLLMIFLSLTNNSVNATDLSDIEANYFGFRLGTVRVCINLAIYKGDEVAKDTLDEADERASNYLYSLFGSDRKRAHAIVESMTKAQLESMDRTGNMTWLTGCEPALDRIRKNDYL